MTYVLCTLIGFSAGYLVARYQQPTIQYPIVPTWQFKGATRSWDGDRWTGEDDAA